MSARAIAWSLLGLCAMACEVGQPVVGRFPEQSGDAPTVGCVRPPVCSEIGDDAVAQVAPRALAQHYALEPDAACRPQLEPDCDPGALAEDADAGVATSLEVDGSVRLSQRALRLSSRTPVEIEWSEAWLHDVDLQLAGPVTLHVRHSERFEDVRIRGEALETAGRPRLLLTEVDAGELVAGDRGHPFEGTLALSRCSLTGAQLIAERVELTSVSFVGGRIESDELDFVDGELADSVVSPGRGRFAEVALKRSEFSDCGALSVLGGSLDRCRIPACAQPPLRLYSTLAIRSFFDGQIETDRTRMETSALGQRSATRITQWGGAIRSSSFCSEARGLIVAGSGFVACSACGDDGLSREGEVCSSSEFPGDTADNLCPELSELTPCDREPERARPLPQTL